MKGVLPVRTLPLAMALVSATLVLGTLSRLPLYDTSPFHGNLFASDLNLTEVDCRCCHSEEVPDRHHLLVEPTSPECIDCHELKWNEMIQQYSVVVTRDCLVCHTGSLADRHHTLPDPPGYDCLDCHALKLDPETGEYFLDFPDNCPVRDSIFGSIKGVVTASEGELLEDVTIVTDDGRYSTLTATDGAYHLEEMEPGDYTLVSSDTGYASESHPITVVTGQTVRIDFVLAPTTQTWNTASIVGAESRLISEVGNLLFSFLIPVGILLLWKGRGRRK